MKYKNKKLILYRLFSILIFIVLFTFFCVKNSISIYAYEAHQNGRNTYVGYTGESTSDWYNDNLLVSNNPMITVLTHGLNSSAIGWSNDAENKNPGDAINLSYDSSSLMEQLRGESSNGATVFLAKMESSTSFYLMELSVQNQLENYSKYLPTISHLTIDDLYKHIIIVFDSKDSEVSNADVYGEFKYMLNRIVCDIAYLSGGVYPKINLIGHSRGGLTNMQYAQDFPCLIDGLFSIGTPYFGSNFGRINLFSYGLDVHKMAGFHNIQDKNLQNLLVNTWNANVNGRYTHIKFYPMAGYSTVDFLDQLLDLPGYTWNEFGGKPVLEQLLDGFGYVGIWIIWNLIKNEIADGIRDQESIKNIPQTPEDVIKDVLDISVHNINNTAIVIDDLFVSKDSQQAFKNGSIYYARVSESRENLKKFYSSLSDANIGKVSSNNYPIVHNLEARDADFIDKILARINIGCLDMFEMNGSGNAITGYKYNITGKIIIPSQINGITVTEIEYRAFDYSLAQEIHIPNTVTIIGAMAFYGCNNMQVIDFGANSQLHTIKDNAFHNCSSLTSISLPNTLTDVGITPFAGCAGLYGYLIPNSITNTQHKRINSRGSLVTGNHNYINGVCIVCGHSGSGAHTHLYDEHMPAPPGKFGNQHYSYCDCSHFKIMPCIGVMPDEPPYDVYCSFCGQYLSDSGLLYSIILPNGDICVSNYPITFESVYQIAMKLGIDYEYSDFLVAIKVVDNSELYIIPKKFELND